MPVSPCRAACCVSTKANDARMLRITRARMDRNKSGPHMGVVFIVFVRTVDNHTLLFVESSHERERRGQKLSVVVSLR